MSDPLAKIKAKLQQELDAFEHELNVDLPKEIAVARAHGDLSENAEYKYAKERQGYVNAKIGKPQKAHGRPWHAQPDQHSEGPRWLWLAPGRSGCAA